MMRTALLALLLALSGCQGKLTEPPEITSEADAGSTELVFLLSHQSFGVDGSQSFTATGVHEGRPVGFDVKLGPWQENPPGYINMSTWDCTAWLSSRGSESDELLKFLDKHYSARAYPRAMASSVEGSALSPWENPGKLEREPVSVVLLFSGGFDETRDAEVWLEVRPKEARVLLREKEPRFRRSLLLALAGPPD